MPLLVFEIKSFPSVRPLTNNMFILYIMIISCWCRCAKHQQRQHIIYVKIYVPFVSMWQKNLNLDINFLPVHPIADSPENKDHNKGKKQGSVFRTARKPAAKFGQPVPGI
jgi:hypothetical protein